MKILRTFLFLSVAASFFACSAQSSKSKPGPALDVAQKTRVAIPKSGLGKEYVLSTSIIPQSGAPTSLGLIGKVIRFERFEDGVDMYESVDGLVVTDDLPARRLLATFPIVEEEGSKLIIDFNQGMRRLAYTGWYLARDGFDIESLERSAELPQARVFEVAKEGETLTIRQAVQVRSRSQDPDLESRYEIRYFLQPYRQGVFEGKEMHPEESRYTRFFTVPGKLEKESGRLSQQISMFDIEEPIEFYYSHNTPESMREAVAEGITYWNKAFGKEVLVAKLAPEGVTAPNATRNIVQWVPWDTAGFAYADILLDPKTGQSLRGQAFLTSVFDISGQARARRILRTLRALGENEEEKSDDEDGEEDKPLFLRHPGCRLDEREFALQMAEGLEEVLSDPKLTEEAVLKIAQAYVREVTAHEVGHVLGLRHNFAASLPGTLMPVELDQFIADFIAGEDLSKYEDEIASTTVMEYSVFTAAVFMGWQIENREEALPHDVGAIKWGYFDDKQVIEDKVAFGSDEETREFGDVRRFDFGPGGLYAEYDRLTSIVNNLPNSVLERFISARAPTDPRDRKSLDAVDLGLGTYSSQIAESTQGILQWFDKKTRSVKVENEFVFVGEVNQEERWEAHWKWLEEQVKALGGMDQILFAHLPVDLKLDSKGKVEGFEAAPKIDGKKLSEKLGELLDSEAYSTFVGLDGETYTWTDEEKETIRKRSAELFGKLEDAILLKTLKFYENAPRDLSLAAVGNLSDDDIVAQLENRIIDFAKAILTPRDKDNRISGKVDKAYVEVPDFKYNYELRVAAAKALNDKTGSYESWAKEAKQQLHAELKKSVEESLNISLFKDFDDKLLSRSLREWYLREQNLLKLLPPDPKANGK